MIFGEDVFSLLKNAQNFLKDKGLEDPKSDVEVLLSAVLQIKRSKLPFIREKKVDKQQISKFNEYILRRAKSEPVYYIIGICEFMGFDFIVNESVLIPRPETEMLVEKVLEISKSESKKSLLDLCCGSGNIALSLSKLGNFDKITASDISEKALIVAEENAKRLKVEDIEFINSDLFENLGCGKFDIIVSNPPYISESEKKTLKSDLFFEPETALFAKDNGLFFYKEIAKGALKRLNKGGHILVELNANLSAEIMNIFNEKGYKNMEIIKDYANLDRILWIK